MTDNRAVKYEAAYARKLYFGSRKEQLDSGTSFDLAHDTALLAAGPDRREHGTAAARRELQEVMLSRIAKAAPLPPPALPVCCCSCCSCCWCMHAERLPCQCLLPQRCSVQVLVAVTAPEVSSQLHSESDAVAAAVDTRDSAEAKTQDPAMGVASEPAAEPAPEVKAVVNEVRACRPQ